MNPKSIFGAALVIGCAGTMWGCQAMSPSSPTALGASGGATVRPFDEAPTPVTTTINIVGSTGTAAYNPNPIQAAIGDMIVWMNGDATVHHIVLDNGTDIGTIAPGQSTAPIAVSTGVAMGYHCTIHPSMVGSINGELPPAPPYYPPYEPEPYY